MIWQLFNRRRLEKQHADDCRRAVLFYAEVSGHTGSGSSGARVLRSPVNVPGFEDLLPSSPPREVVVVPGRQLHEMATLPALESGPQANPQDDDVQALEDTTEDREEADIGSMSPARKASRSVEPHSATAATSET